MANRVSLCACRVLVCSYLESEVSKISEVSELGELRYNQCGIFQFSEFTIVGEFTQLCLVR